MSKRNHAQRKPNKPGRRKVRYPGRGVVIGMVIVGIVVIVAILVYGGKSGNSPQATANAGEISVSQAYQLYQQGAYFLDVRSTDEWNAGHIPNSTLIPLDQLSTRLDEVPRDGEIIVICRSGNRSRSGRDILLNAGFTQVSSVNGGITAWSEAGYPIESTQP